MAGGFAPPKLAEFILTERLGSGTYATVYKAYRKKDTREVVAVKVVGKKGLNKASVENLLTEIEILKTVRHPHIVQLKDFQVRYPPDQRSAARTTRSQTHYRVKSSTRNTCSQTHNTIEFSFPPEPHAHRNTTL
ncbi:ULK3 kinase, partial [Polyodon spathula]|nr:ULK3 kinase [Polyodon spathula]